MSIEIPSISQEWVSTLVVADADPTALPVRFAFLSVDAEPTTGDWTAGEWDGAGVQQPDGRWQVRARVKIGPDTDLALPDGTYGAWVRVVEADPEGPTRHFDTISIT